MKIPPKATPEESKQIVKDFYKKHERDMPKAFNMKVASRYVRDNPDFAKKLIAEFLEEYRPDFAQTFLTLIMAKDYPMLLGQFYDHDYFFKVNHLNNLLFDERNSSINLLYLTDSDCLEEYSIKYYQTLSDDLGSLAMMAYGFRKSGNKDWHSKVLNKLSKMPPCGDICMDALNYHELVAAGYEAAAKKFMEALRVKYTDKFNSEILDNAEKGKLPEFNIIISEDY